MFVNFLFYFIYFCSFNALDAAKIVTEQNSRLRIQRSNTTTKNWQTIIRQKGTSSDVIFAFSDGKCDTLFDANPWLDDDIANSSVGIISQNINEEPSACICPRNTPVFRQDKQKCVTKLDECAAPILFKETFSNLNSKNTIYVPTIRLPNLASDEGFQPQLLDDDFLILWTESAIKIRPNIAPRCNLTKVSYMGMDTVWSIGNTNWFKLGWSTRQNSATILWNVSQFNATILEKIKSQLHGTIMIIDLQCLAGNSFRKHCMMFRIGGEIVADEDVIDARSITTTEPITEEVVGPEEGGRQRFSVKGVSEPPIDDDDDDDNNNNNSSSVNNSKSDASPKSHIVQQGRFETILIILLAILLFLSIFGSIILWNICWRIKKSELISSLQMQFLYHIKQEKEKASAVADAQHRYRAMAAAQVAAGEKNHPSFGYTSNAAYSHVVGAGMVDDGNGNGSFSSYSTDKFCEFEGDSSMIGRFYGGNGPTTAQIVKRKLYFSAEFFEPYFMANPPPMAEQFLHDLRKMITVAKQRISLRRHIPQLSMIIEEEESICENPQSIKSTCAVALSNYDADLNYTVKNFKAPLKNLEINVESSPKSSKSVSDDSGRETSAEASGSSSSSDGSSSTESVSPGLTPPPVQKQLSKRGDNQASTKPKNPNFRQISELTHRNHQSSTVASHSPNSSRIPISKSPRLQPKSLTMLTTSTINLDLESPTTTKQVCNFKADSVTDRQKPLVGCNNETLIINRSMSLTPPPLPTTGPPSMPPTSYLLTETGPTSNGKKLHKASTRQSDQPITGTPAHIKRATAGTNLVSNRNTVQQNGTSGMKRSTYAVFPSDSMLKKSLPRRSKKLLPSKAVA